MNNQFWLIIKTILFLFGIIISGMLFIRNLAGLHAHESNRESIMISHGVTAEFVQKMRSLGFGEINNKEIIRLKIHQVDESIIENIKNHDLFNNKPNTVVALQLLTLDDSLIEEIKKLDIDYYSLENLLRSRSGQWFNFQHDLDMVAALESVVERIYLQPFECISNSLRPR